MQQLERFTPDMKGRIAYEHLHRYAVCRDFVRGLQVLDVGCGDGYGTALLGECAAAITGLDVDEESIGAASVLYGVPGKVLFQVGSAFELPFADGCFDVVTALEIIEHVTAEQQERLVSEIRRVLRPGGLFIVSTPNKPVYNRYKPPNVFHLREFEKREFAMLLGKAFRHVHLLGQRLAVVSSLGSSDKSVGLPPEPAYRAYLGEHGSAGLNVDTGVARLPDPEYFLAFCSNEPVDWKVDPHSIFYCPDDDLWLEQSRVLAWASGLHEEDEALRRRVAELETWLATAERDLEAERTVLAPLRGEVDAARAEKEAVRAELEQLRTQRDMALAERDEATRLKQASIEEGEAALSQAQAESLTLQRRVEALETDIGDLTRQAELAAAEIAVLKAAAERAEDQAAELAGELERRNLSMKAALDNAAQLASALREAEEAVSSFHAAGPTLELKPLLDARDDEIAALRSALNAGREEVAQLQVAQRRELNRALAQRMEAQAHAAVTGIRARLDLDRRRAAAAVREHLRQDPPSRRMGRPGRSARSALRAAGLLDASWYLEANPDAGTDAEAHFVRRGVWRGREPNPLFHSEWFARRHPDELDGLPAAFAYAASPRRATLSPHPFFLPHYYLERNPDVAASPGEAFQHFRQHGEREHRQVHPLIDLAWMAGQMPELLQDERWLSRYATDPTLFHLSPHALFDTAHYLAHSPDVGAAKINPLLHYLVWGWREGRSPHPYLDGDWYLSRNPDVLAAGENPLVHFVWHGAREGRDPNPAFETRAYLTLHSDVASDPGNPFVHFLQFGRQEGRAFSGDPEIVRARQLLTFSRQRPRDLFGELLDPERASGSVEVMLRASEQADADIDEGKDLPVIEYWLPQAANDFLATTGRSGQIPLYRYLYAAIERFSDAPVDFLHSEEFRTLFARARLLSAQRAQRQSGPLAASIIIPVYRNLLDTLACLVSLLEQETELTYEILIGDDHSPDVTPDVLVGIGGIVHVIRHEQNLGFLGNCNSAAEAASGKNVVFLNNDTLILSGWLDSLVGALDRDPTIGLVGSKLINWDGTLQEAGGIFWKDGSAWNYGRNQDPRRPEFNYLKDTDYCSGAAIALPTALWRALKGFDPLFSPAYCEDADIAFRVRAKGLRAVYQPFAEVIHHEGRSHGRDVSSGVKAYQVSNMKKLLERWGAELEGEHYPNGEEVFLARDRSAGKPHILFVDHYVPQWDRDAGSRSALHYIQLFLKSGFHVTFWPDNRHLDPIYGPQLQEMGVEVIYGGEPDLSFDAWIERNGKYIDYVLLSRPHVSLKYIVQSLHKTKAKVIYYGHDLHYRRMELQRDVEGDETPQDVIDGMRKDELFLCRNVDVFMYPGREEVDLVSAQIGGASKGLVIPVITFEDREVAEFDPHLHSARDQKLVFFVGGFAHVPNVDGVKWFTSQVWPLVQARDPAYRLVIAGSNPPPGLVGAGVTGVELLGRISDEQLNAFYRTVGMAIAPLRFGGGVKGKVIEALAKAVPVVTTSVGVQGIPCGEEVAWVADSAEDFAAAVLSVAASAELTERKVKAGVSFIRETYSVEAAARKIGAHVPEVLGEGTRTRGAA